MELCYFATGRTEIFVGIFRINTALNGVTVEENLILCFVQLCACGNTNLPLHKVKTCYHFGNAMLNLESGIHLHKVEVFVLVKKELNCTNRVVVNSLCRLDGCIHHFLTNFRCKGWAGAFFNKLLVFALNGTFSFPKTENISVFVAQKLHFNMFNRL